jgi:hypothetical protein
MKSHLVVIGRLSGPSTDVDLESEFTEKEIEVIKDVLAIVNGCAANKERWYYRVDNGRLTIPEL